jgi:NADH-quinone oxidoreductase subunit L
MSRQVMLVFSGQSRWVEQNEAHGAAGTAGTVGAHEGSDEPHEAPWVMSLPVALLGVLSVIGWLINAPFGGLDFLDKWLAPVFPATVATPFTVASGTKWVIGAIATGVAFIGLIAGLRVWQRSPFQPKLEPAVLEHGWYIDEATAHTVSGPLTGLANAFSYAVDLGFVDATINGVARLTAGTGRQLRRIQTGYVRNYALGIGIGAAIILFYVATRAGS